jgi:alpha-galactosidase
MSVKIAMIGGGSSSFVPPLVRQFIRSDVLGDAELTLMDVNEERVRVMEALARKLVDAEGSRLRVSSTLEQREALTGADFVIVAISVGGMAAWEMDMEIPGRYGLIMHVADSIGPGGLMRTLRNAPVQASVARDVAEVGAPDAWVFNYTNPAPVEGLSMLTVPDVNVISLCSCTAEPTSRRWLAARTGVEPEEIAMPPIVAGINHCASVKELRATDGTDLMPRMPERVENPVERWALETYGVLPYCWSHWTEFYPQLQRLEQEYEGTAQSVKMRYGITTHNMEYERSRPKMLAELAKQWTAPEAGPVTLADLPPGDEEEGIEVIEILEAIVANRNEVHIVNAPNNGVIPNLPGDAMVEVCARVNRYGVHPIYTGPLHEALAGHLSHYVSMQRQMVKAALTGDRQSALHALLLDPTTSSALDADETEAMLGELLEAQAEHLPLFTAAAA